MDAVPFSKIMKIKVYNFNRQHQNLQKNIFSLAVYHKKWKFNSIFFIFQNKYFSLSLNEKRRAVSPLLYNHLKTKKEQAILLQKQNIHRQKNRVFSLSL